jgi:hypothetical protein
MTGTWRPKQQPWEAPDYDDEVVYAARAFFKGEALPHQQVKLRDWLMYVSGAGEGYDDLSFRPGPDGARATDFAEGKRFVGLQLRKMLRAEVTPKLVKRA